MSDGFRNLADSMLNSFRHYQNVLNSFSTDTISTTFDKNDVALMHLIPSNSIIIF